MVNLGRAGLNRGTAPQRDVGGEITHGVNYAFAPVILNWQGREALRPLAYKLSPVLGKYGELRSERKDRTLALEPLQATEKTRFQAWRKILLWKQWKHCPGANIFPVRWQEA